MPSWMAEAVDAYLNWSWPTWRAQTAYQLGSNMLGLMRRIAIWLTVHRQVKGWETFQRADLDAWVAARQQDAVSDSSIRTELGQLRSLLKFLEARGYTLDPGLYRIQQPQATHRVAPALLI